MIKEKKGLRFSKNVQTDEQSSFISCPEYVAQHIAKTIKASGDFKTAVELCCCIGSTSIQLAKVFDHITAVDLNAARIAMAKENAKLYGVEDKIDFISGDVLDEKLLSTIPADFAVLDPGWSTRPMDRSSHVSDINLTQPSLKVMFDLTKKHITSNIVARVPRTFEFETLKELGKCRLENIIINGEIVFKVAYFFKYDENNEEDVVFE